MSPAGSRPLRLAALALGGLVLGLVLVDVLLREYPPVPVVQIVRSSHPTGSVRLRHGEVIWGVSDRESRDCVEAHPERRRILVFGDSIPYGTGLLSEDVFTRLLEARLNERFPEPGFCVMNFAQPGFGFDQSFAIARDEIPALKPALIFWGLWTENRLYRELIDGAAYNVWGFQLHPDGYPFPGAMGWLPEPVNRAFFRHWRLYQYWTLASGARLTPLPPKEQVERLRREKLDQLPPLAKAVGAPLTIFLGTFLDKPFRELQSDRRLEDLQEALTGLARDSGVEVVRLQDLLVDQDYLVARQDACCHYSPSGHAMLAEAFEAIVVRQLGLPERAEAAQ